MVEEVKTHYAICMLKEDGNSGVNGWCKFVQVEGQQVQITAEMTGLTPGLHGFHVHVFGKCSFNFLIQIYLDRQLEQWMRDGWSTL